MDVSIKKKAKQLRLKGYSYSEIHRRLSVSKSTLSTWFSGLEISDLAKERIHSRVNENIQKTLVKRNKLQTEIAKGKSLKIREQSKFEIGRLSDRDLLILGTSLYWGEGHKRPVFKNGIERTWHMVSFTNTDPKMIRVFIKFLDVVMGVPKELIKPHVRVFNDKDVKSALEYWINVTGISKKNFCKTTVVKSLASKGVRPYNRLPYGTIQIRVYRTEKFHQIMGWIEGLSKI